MPGKYNRSESLGSMAELIVIPLEHINRYKRMNFDSRHSWWEVGIVPYSVTVWEQTEGRKLKERPIASLRRHHQSSW